MLATKLENVFLEGRKLFANILRFLRDSKRGDRPFNPHKGSPEVIFKALRKEVSSNQGFNGFTTRDNHSFAEVTNSKKEGGKEVIRKGKSICALSFEVD